MDWLEAFGLLAAALVAGAVNAVAGGGSLISFPALLVAGYPAKTANVTNTVALWPGYLGGSLGYRNELRYQRRRIIFLLAPSVLGAIAGSAILLSTSEDAFEAVVPFLILFATALMAFQKQLAALAERHQPGGKRSGPLAAAASWSSIPERRLRCLLRRRARASLTLAVSRHTYSGQHAATQCAQGHVVAAA